MPKRQRIGKSPDFFHSWDYILKDLQNLLGAKARVDTTREAAAESLETMMAICLPALCQRLCQLASRFGPTMGGTSSSVMVCHDNNVELGRLHIRVYESFPNYGLDRTIDVGNGQWRLHLRDVDYRDPDNFQTNDEVVAKALAHQRDIHLPVNPTTSTPSEKQRSICAIHSIIPSQLKSPRDIENLPVGAVVALNIDFYAVEPDGYASLHETLERKDILKDLLSQVHELSLFNSLPRDARRSAAQDVVENIQSAKTGALSLPEIVQQSLTIINYGELKVSGGSLQGIGTSSFAGIDMGALASELGSLKSVLQESATTSEQNESINSIEAAEKAAGARNAKGAIHHLKRAGKWAWDTATDIGVNVVSEVIKKFIIP